MKKICIFLCQNRTRLCVLLLILLLAAAFCSCNGQNNNINRGSADGGAKGGGIAANRGDTARGQNTESGGVSLIERAYSYGDFSLPSAGSNPNNNVG